jgi:DNA repair photolyase
MILGTKEWAPDKDNCILGCENDCRYCFSKKNAIRFKRATKETWKIERPNPNAKPKKHNGRVMFPTSHDLHYKNLEFWNGHLCKLLTFGNDLLIVSKPEWEAIRYIIETYKTTPFIDQIEFRFTIGTDDETTRQFWEPNAPSISERLQCLRYAFEEGFRTSVSMEPILMLHPDVKPFVNRIEPYVTGEIWIGLMNYLNVKDFAGSDLLWFGRQRNINSLWNIQAVYDLLKDNPKIRWKDSVRDLLGLK